LADNRAVGLGEVVQTFCRFAQQGRYAAIDARGVEF
jgi:hypothetical protein